MRAIKVHTFQKEKYTLVFGAFILGFTLLAGRLCYLMIFRSEELSKKGNKTTVAKACSFGRGSKKEGRKGIFERKNKE